MKPTTRSLGWLWALALLAVPSAAAAQPWTGIIDPSRVIDWSLGEAGVAGGIPNRTFNCATIAAYTGSAATINNALSACANNTSALAAGGGVVNLQAGTFNLTSGINLSGISNVTLRGAGANQTKLVMTGSVSCFFGGSVCMGNSTPQTAATDGAGGTPAWVSNWTAGYAKGTTVITLASTANVSVGDVIVLDQTDDTSDTGNIYVCQHTTGTGPNGSPCSLEGGSYGRQGPPVRSQTQLVRVTAKNGTNLTITPGLYMPNWSASKNPQAYGIGPNNGQNTGIENLSIDHTRSGAGDGAFVIVNGYNNWIKGVRSLTIPAVMGGGNPSQLAHIWMLQTARFEVRDSYLYGVPDGQSRNYGLLYQSTTNILNVNNISQHVSNPHMLGTDVGSVSAFNYSADNWSTEAGGGQMPAIFDQHAAGLSMHLFEGNQGNQWNGDTFHGSANLNTVFRNLFIGQNPEVVSPRKSNCTTPVTLLSYVRLFNFVGNILGLPGTHTNYQYTEAVSGPWHPVVPGPETIVWVLDSPDACGNPAGEAGQAMWTDPLVHRTLLRWGNCDSAHGFSAANCQFSAAEVPSGLAQFSNPVPAGRALPASLFLPSRPSWWGTPWGVPGWPAVGPDVTGGDFPSFGTSGYGGLVYRIPAKLCYDHMTVDPAYSSLNPQETVNDNLAARPGVFNAATCYTGTPGARPSPPTGTQVQ